MRAFIIDNALMWLRDFHVDGLRLDAVHALQDDSPTHILAELADRGRRRCATQVGRPLTLIAESDLNDPVMIDPQPTGYGLDAQWDDDVHHALHSALYRRDAGLLRATSARCRCWQKVLTRAFLHDGTYSTFRGRDARPRRSTATRTPGWQFVVCLQNHDQVGNRAVGDRLPEITSPGLLRVGAVLLLTAPFTPMLWMGEEWAASTRWPFFTSHPEPELARGDRQGPRRGVRRARLGRQPDDRPAGPEDAYRSAILDWDEVGRDGHARDARPVPAPDRAARRRARPARRRPAPASTSTSTRTSAGWSMHRGGLRVIANLSTQPRTVPVDAFDLLLATGSIDVGRGEVTVGPQSAASSEPGDRRVTTP